VSSLFRRHVESEGRLLGEERRHSRLPGVDHYRS
jgi:hypothetical protein